MLMMLKHKFDFLIAYCLFSWKASAGEATSDTASILNGGYAGPVIRHSPVRSQRAAFCCVLVLTALISVLGLRQAFAFETNVGFVDSVSFDGRFITASGWVIGPEASPHPHSINISIGGKLAFSGRPHVVPRPDVAAGFGRSDAGWSIAFAYVEEGEPGEKKVEVRAIFADGATLTLPASNTQAQTVNIGNPGPSGVLSFLALFTCILTTGALMARAYFLARKDGNWVGFEKTFVKFGVIASALCFMILVGSGITGSSIKLLETPFVKSGITDVTGSDRTNRSDEWLVFTPFALSQAKQIPPFPVVNQSVGPSGQNMLVVGMSGVPVRHITAFAKPSTWGFFFLPDNLALSWYWWLPFFGCFVALWSAIRIVLPQQAPISALLSLGFVTMPYVTAWSGWPAYQVMFGAAGFSAIIGITKESTWLRGLLSCFVLGIAASGFVLTLYPAWQVPVAYAFAAMFFGIAARDKLWRQWSLRSSVLLALACLIACIILSSWWIDCREAVSAMVATVYPGQRRSPGGGVPLYRFAEGWFDVFAMFSNSLAGQTNESEVASFPWIFPVLLIVAPWQMLRQRVFDYLVFSLLMVVTLLCFYEWYGIGEPLAKLTLLAHTAGTRPELGLGLAQVALTAAWMNFYVNHVKPCQDRIHFPALVAVTVFLGLLGYSFVHVPDFIKDLSTPATTFLLFVFGGVAGGFIAFSRVREGGACLAAFGASISLTFNPVRQIERAPYVASIPCENSRTRLRVLSLNSNLVTQALLSAGYSVVNAAHYYPQRTIWQTLDPAGTKASIYNRYQHLVVSLGEVDEGSDFRIESPQGDMVKLTVDGARFDFSSIGAGCVLSLSPDAPILRTNPGLKEIGGSEGWVAFKVNAKAG